MRVKIRVGPVTLRYLEQGYDNRCEPWPRSIPKELEVDALIDTGASVTIIDKSIVDDMPLRCFGYCPISGFDSQDSGSGKAKEYPNYEAGLVLLNACGDAPLLTIKTGWTENLRRDYLAWWNGSRSKQHPLEVVKWFTDAGVNFNNGASFNGFVNKTLEEVKATMTPAEIAALGDLTKVQSAVKASTEVRAFVKEWTSAELLPLLDQVGKGRDFARGKAAYTASQCFLCHRYGDEGGAAGPDLTNVATRFNRKDLLESITEPSKVVSEQYQMTMFSMKDGGAIAGRISQENDETVVVMTNPFDPTITMTVSKPDIKSKDFSKVSLMPHGLLNTLKEDEILDLLAYLESMGDEKHPNFSK